MMLKEFFGAAGAAAASANPVTAVANVVSQIFENKTKKLTQEEVIQRLMLQPQLAQIELNKVEAQHRSVWVAGWRPAAGWVCVAGLLYHFLGAPILNGLLAKYGMNFAQVNVYELSVILTGMLGLSGLRTSEKKLGRAK